MPARGGADAARAAAREDGVNIQSRTGLTTLQIDFMKQLYAREPDAFGASSLDMMKRTATPQLSSRMAEELRDLRQGGAHRSAAEMIEHHQNRERRVMAPATGRRLVGGLHLKQGVTMYGDPAYGPASSRGHAGGSTARSLARDRGEDGLGTGRSSVTIGPSTSRSQRSSDSRTGRSTARSCAMSTGRTVRAAAEEELSRLGRQRKELAQQLAAVEATLVEGETTPEEYDQATGYAVFKSRMYLTESAKQMTGKQPVVADERRQQFARKGTQHSRYANQVCLGLLPPSEFLLASAPVRLSLLTGLHPPPSLLFCWLQLAFAKNSLRGMF